MILRKLKLWATIACGLTTSICAVEASSLVAVVNFSSCITDSKFGKKEQENFENVRKQIAAMIDDTETEIKDLSAKFEDTEYLDSLSPKAEEEMKTRYQALSEDLARYQGQFYQVMQQANMQLIHKLSAQIARASEKIAKQKNLDYVINKEACFYYRPDLDLTAQVIAEMDRNFELDTKRLTDNAEDFPATVDQAIEETALQTAG